MSLIKQYRVYCVEEAKYITFWDMVAPTQCPNVHGDRTIDHAKTVILRSIEQNETTVKEPTTGQFQAMSRIIDIPACSPGDVVCIDLDWPMDISIWNSTIRPIDSMLGDQLCLIYDPDQSIGTLTDDALVGDTILHVSESVLSIISLGYELTLDNGVRRQDVGRVVDIDLTAKTIEIEKPLEHNYYSVSPTVVLLNICLIKDLFIDKIDDISFGTKGFRSKAVPARTKLRVKYTNNNGEAKMWCWVVEYYY